MKKYLGIFLFAVFGLQSCANRDGEIIEMLEAMQQQNEGLKVQISTLQNSANSALATLNKISLTQIATDKKLEVLQTDLKSVLTQLATISAQMAVANGNTADLKVKLDKLQVQCAELIKKVEAMGAPIMPSISVIYRFDDCDLSGFVTKVDNSNVQGSTTINPSSKDGCGVQLEWPVSIYTTQKYSYGTYEVDAKALSTIANQSLGVFYDDPFQGGTGFNGTIICGVQPNGTDDEGWSVGDYISYSNVSVSYPNWYHITLNVTPNLLTFKLDNKIMYQTDDYSDVSSKTNGNIILSSYSYSEYDNLKFTPYDSSLPLVFNINENNLKVSSFSSNSSVSWSLTGDDKDLFRIDSNGNLTFINSADFETPLDLNRKNNYNVNIVVTNSLNISSSQKVTINILDVD
jgi:hypothetical protein